MVRVVEIDEDSEWWGGHIEGDPASTTGWFPGIVVEKLSNAQEQEFVQTGRVSAAQEVEKQRQREELERKDREARERRRQERKKREGQEQEAIREKQKILAEEEERERLEARNNRRRGGGRSSSCRA